MPFHLAGSDPAALEQLTEHPTPVGDFVWPRSRSCEEAETSLLADTGADPEAATLVSDASQPSTPLPLIDAELIPEADVTVVELAGRLPDRRWLPWLAALGLGTGLLIGLDVLEARESEPIDSTTFGTPGSPLPPGLAASQGPFEPRADQPLDVLYGPRQISPAGTSELEPTPETATGAQAAAGNDRSSQQAPRQPQSARSGKSRTQAQGEKGWVIRRR